MAEIPGLKVLEIVSRYCKKGLLSLLLVLVQVTTACGAETYTIEIRDHLFYPDELQVPAGQKVKLIVLNKDASPEEFESFELNREKVIGGGRKAVIFIGPLKPGEYPFFGEFHPKTAQGKIIAK